MSAQIYPVPFLIGDGTGETLLLVKYIAEFPRDSKGDCAFCHGDPCAEHSPSESRIAQYHERHAEDRLKYRGCYDTCPLCKGAPS